MSRSCLLASRYRSLRAGETPVPRVNRERRGLPARKGPRAFKVLLERKALPARKVRKVRKGTRCKGREG